MGPEISLLAVFFTRCHPPKISTSGYDIYFLGGVRHTAITATPQLWWRTLTLAFMLHLSLRWMVRQCRSVYRSRREGRGGEGRRVRGAIQYMDNARIATFLFPYATGKNPLIRGWRCGYKVAEPITLPCGLGVFLAPVNESAAHRQEAW